MLYGDDVVWLMWQEGIVFMKKAIFTSVTGALTNQPAKFCWHIMQVISAKSIVGPLRVA